MQKFCFKLKWYNEYFMLRSFNESLEKYLGLWECYIPEFACFVCSNACFDKNTRLRALAMKQICSWSLVRQY